jgi:hypothetical protein
VDYLTDEQRSYGDKEPLELGADLQFGPLAAYKAKDNSPKGIATEAKRCYQEALKLKIPKDKIFV